MNTPGTDRPKLADATLSLHAGEGVRNVGEPLNAPPAFSTSFYSHPDAIGFSANDLSPDAPQFYTRWGNPTLDLLERRLAALEQGEAAASFASGMAAITALLFHRLKAGDHLVLSDVCYAGVAELAHDTLPRYGIEVSRVDASRPEAVAAAMRPNTRHVHVETPANPILRLADVAAIARIAHDGGAELSVDSTIGTPLATKPLLLGADYVVHSLTKYLCGHGDALGGAVIGRGDAMAGLRQSNLIHLGGCLAPFSAWLILRGLETLAPRMALHEANARRVEAFLADHPRVRSVLWPGSPRHPQHDLAARQMRNFSGLLAFSVKDGEGPALARRMADRLKVFSYAVSLGKAKSLIFYIPTADILRSSFRLEGPDAESYREWAGEGVFRVSVGLEDADDLIADLDAALGA
ncbi:Methionine gamma-lyase [Aquisphaera giovannonii]|uniref:Methionine gamma-lyase n=1 Tax=Aquisphaera giovannonii TaxID=406548 RepID=A0A5B9WG19_9BACT|nr:aminotransferase class I/II-fold pyridoxal phosphate-dependent enzyme [Aquisphaera giovannonii]QEH38951.1 Methionine gamma-lyase [Aquisphaera giovannonii]